MIIKIIEQIPHWVFTAVIFITLALEWFTDLIQTQTFLNDLWWSLLAFCMFIHAAKEGSWLKNVWVILSVAFLVFSILNLF